jgi:chromate reductase, NAD(P)H dehydrogenase (quinone)
MPGPRILVIPGSLRTGSHNARLAALAVKELALLDVEVTHISLEDYELPLFDADLAAAESGPPSAAIKLKQMLMAHRGIFITSPEYSASVTPLVKNADLRRFQGPGLRTRIGDERRRGRHALHDGAAANP